MDIDKPKIGDRDILVRVAAAGLDPGIWHLMTGRPYPVRMGFGLRRPKTPVLGADTAGHVEAVGRNVTRFAPGDEVFGVCKGSFAEYARTTSDKLVSKPPNLTFEQAAAVPTSAVTALRGLRDTGNIQSGQRVLIIGAAGGVGTFAVQIAKAYGAEVTGVCSTAKTDLVRALGADDVIDYLHQDFADGSRYDLVLDTAGHRSLSHLRRAITPRGRLVIVGSEVGGRLLGGTDRQLRAMLLSPFVGQKLGTLVAMANQEDLETVADLLATDAITPVIDRTYTLGRVPEAIRYLHDGHARGKVVITV